MHVSEIDTPALVVDLDIFERNLARVADYAREHALRLRPHTKTHKSVRLARRQIASGAAGLTVAKVSEAEIMAVRRPRDLLVAFPIIGQTKLARLTQVARQTRITVALDSTFCRPPTSDAARAAQVEIGVWPKSMPASAGSASPRASRSSNSRRPSRNCPICASPASRSIPGTSSGWTNPACARWPNCPRLCAAFSAISAPPVSSPGLSAAGPRPTLFHSHEIHGLTEIRPGTYVFNDLNTIRSSGCALEDCAATILATVVSTARPGQMIIDGGSKTFSSDRLANTSEVTFGRLAEAPGARFHKMNEEHGFIDLDPRRNRIQRRRPGARDPQPHLRRRQPARKSLRRAGGDKVEEIWPVDARGKLQ